MMKPLSISLFALLFCSVFFSSMTIADQAIAKCIDAHGDLTFTDYLCSTEEPGENPLLMTDEAIHPSVRARIPSVIKAEAIASNVIKSATAEAKNECSQRFNNYFRKKHPSALTIPEVEFTDVVDQYINKANISISLSGAVEYTDESFFVYSTVECTVQRLRSTSDWMVGYRER